MHHVTLRHRRSVAIATCRPSGPEASGSRASPRWRQVAGAALSALVLAGCKVPAFGAYHPADQQSQWTYYLWSGLMFGAIGVGGLVLGLILWAVIRYRVANDDDGSLPVQTHENIPWEIAYTITPVLIVAVIFGFTVVTENKVDALSPKPAVQVHATAYRWGWIFHYSGTSVSEHTTSTTYAELMLPEGETTEITLTSNDVVHEFLMPNYLFGRYAQPGVVNRFDFTPTKTGTFLGHCGVYCGLYHSEMLFTVKVVSPATFSAWLASQQAKAG